MFQNERELGLAIPALVADASGVVLSLNDAMATLCNAMASATGIRLADLLPDPADIAALIDGSPGTSKEFRLASADETERHAVFQVAALLPDGRRLISAFDTTDYRARETALEDDCRRYLDMATAGSDTVHESIEHWGDTKGVLRIWGARHPDGKLPFRDRTLIWPDEIVDMTYMPDELAGYFELIRARKPYQNMIYKLKRDDGREIYIRASAVPFSDRKGNFRGYRGISIDVTKQVLAERALKESQEKVARSENHLSRAQRVSATGSTDLDLATMTSEWSDGLYRILGVARGSLSTTRLADIKEFIHPDDWEKVKQWLADMASGNAPPPSEYRIVRRDGSVAILCSESELIRDEAGRPVRVISTMKDVTEMRGRIVALEDARERLQHQGEELEAAAAKLAKARDAAVVASHAKSAFVANMSHELRTPLNAILGFSEMIEGGFLGELSERYRAYGADIHASGQHLLELINQILDLSKVEAGRMELQESEFAPAQAVEACEKLLAERAAKAGVNFSVALQPDLPRLRADELKFRQVLLNLASNAIKFTPNGGEVKLSVHADARGLVVAVSDTGVGMKAEDIPLALEPFRQVGDDQRHKQQGTGLGLPLAKAFVELHDGVFEITSELQRGTTITVTFPAERLCGATDCALSLEVAILPERGLPARK